MTDLCRRCLVFYRVSGNYLVIRILTSHMAWIANAFVAWRRQAAVNCDWLVACAARNSYG
jgi:hypothetical protein